MTIRTLETPDCIEILAELFNLHDFEIHYSDGQDIDYNPETKVIRMAYDIDQKDEMLSLGHEIMHHKQTSDGKRMDELDREDYNTHTHIYGKDSRFNYIVRQYPLEIEANAFSCLFVNKFYEFLLSKIWIGKPRYTQEIKDTKNRGKIPKPPKGIDPRVLNEIYAKEQTEYERLEKEYGKRLLELYEKYLTSPVEKRPNTIKVVTN